MKGKIAFVLGAAVGYVLGSRAGRARYEQIKRGSKVIWNSAPVQQGVGAVQGVVGDGVGVLKSAALQAGQDALASLIRPSTPSPSAPPEGHARPARAESGAASTGNKPATPAKPAASAKSAATAKPAAKKSSASGSKAKEGGAAS